MYSFLINTLVIFFINMQFQFAFSQESEEETSLEDDIEALINTSSLLWLASDGQSCNQRCQNDWEAVSLKNDKSLNYLCSLDSHSQVAGLNRGSGECIAAIGSNVIRDTFYNCLCIRLDERAVRHETLLEVKKNLPKSTPAELAAKYSSAIASLETSLKAQPAYNLNWLKNSSMSCRDTCRSANRLPVYSGRDGAKGPLLSVCGNNKEFGYNRNGEASCLLVIKEQVRSMDQFSCLCRPK